MTRDEKKLTELNKELDNLQHQIDEVQKKIEDVKANATWPKPGDTYYHMYSDGEVRPALFAESILFRGRLGMGNVFKTFEDAEFAREQLKVIAELKKFALTPEEAYNKLMHEEERWYFDTDGVSLYIDPLVSRGCGELYFDSKETARRAITAVGVERIKKYYLGMVHPDA